MTRFIIISALLIALVVPAVAKDDRGIAIRPVAPTGEKVKGDQWVLTIGIDTYLSWPRLKTAANDAKTLKSVLLERYHVDPSRVVELYNENATRKNILAALRDLTKKVKPEDSLLIYYAGHGHIDSITKKGSWIPVESGTDDPSAWIDNRTITDYLNIDAIKAKHVLLVSDSCFSGDFFRGSRGAIPEVTDTVIKKAYQLSSRQAITSGGLEPVSDAGFGGNSVFSHFLIAALKNNSKPYLIPSELFPSIKSGVAQNAEQFPQMGSLYGVGGQDGGELVLFLKQENKLGNLSADSVNRQKELEQLKKAEAEAAIAKQKEQAEISKKQAELELLDKQIAEMRGRLGSGSTRANDGLDALVAMVEQKEQQGQKLEIMREQRETEELKRQQEIEHLRQEAFNKRSDQIHADIAKYQKVVSSKYGLDMKDAAWDALIANYPESKGVTRYDLDSLSKLLGIEAVVVSDKSKGLMWAKNGNIAGEKMNWKAAINWVKKQDFGGYRDWRLPTKEELEAFSNMGGNNPYEYHNNHGFSNIQTDYYWSGTTDANGGDYAWVVKIGAWNTLLNHMSNEYYVLPVRNIQNLTSDAGIDNLKIALIAAQAGDNAKAILHYKKALLINKNDNEARTSLISIYTKSKQYDDISMLLKEAVELSPDDPVNHYKLGLIYDFKKEYDNAVASYKKAIELKPDNARALNALGRLYMKTGRLSEAKETLEAAKKADPTMEETSVLLNNLRDEFNPESRKISKGENATNGKKKNSVR